MPKSKAVVALFATDRLVQLVVEDELTRPVREAIEKRWPGSGLAYAVNCRACASVWVGLLVSSGLIPRRVLSGLALSSAVQTVRQQDDRVGSLVSTWLRKSRGA